MIALSGRVAELSRYLLNGGVLAAVNIGLQHALCRVLPPSPSGYLVASVVASSVAILINYRGQLRFVFNRYGCLRRYSYVQLGLIGYTAALSAALLPLFSSIDAAWAAYPISAGSSVIFGYLLAARYVFPR